MTCHDMARLVDDCGSARAAGTPRPADEARIYQQLAPLRHATGPRLTIRGGKFAARVDWDSGCIRIIGGTNNHDLD